MGPGMEELERLVAPLRRDPDHSAVLTDVDGTIAPIVVDPNEATVPEETREVLRALARQYALVACLSGRRATDARRVVGLDELAYSGNHGFELLLPGESEVHPDPSLDGHEADAPRFVRALDRSELERVGIRTEDKGAIVALHWRGADNEGAAESLAQEIASEAEWQGLVPHRGRKVLEIRPPVEVNKGQVVRELISRYKLRAALFAGDDVTDLDAFDALPDGVRVGVRSDEGPPEIVERADLVVDDMAEVLAALAL